MSLVRCSVFIFLPRFKIFLSVFLSICLLASLTGVHAQKLDPLALVEAVVNEVLEDIAANKALYQSDKTRLRRMVDQRITPHFNIVRITQLAMGKNWSSANEDQQQRLANAFQTLLIRTYADSLLDIPENSKQRYQIRSQKQISPERMVVNVAVTRVNADPVQLSLRLEQHDDAWQIIDVVIDGVSMVITYRSQFEQKIRSSGIEGLISSLQTEW